MAKINRNQPCRSGRKYKHCCLLRQRAGHISLPVPRRQISLTSEAAKIQQAAMRRQERVLEQGVFVLFSTTDGDAWVLEATGGDAFQAAAAGQPLPLPVHEDRELIEVDWSHAFAVQERGLLLTAHQDGAQMECAKAPIRQISAALQRIAEQLSCRQQLSEITI